MEEKLAIHGGPKVRTEPLVPESHLRARFGREEKEALAAVVDSGHLCRVSGRWARRFEEEGAALFGVAGGAASTSGTAAIHCALAALGIGPGDEVITSPVTDMGSVIPIIAQNAVPVFADVDPRTGNMTAEAIERVITGRGKYAGQVGAMLDGPDPRSGGRAWHPCRRGLRPELAGSLERGPGGHDRRDRLLQPQ